MQANEIEQLIKTELPDAFVKVEGADGQHFEALIVSEKFVGMRSLSRHRLAYAGLGELISSGALHALSLRTLTPEQFAAEQAGQEQSS